MSKSIWSEVSEIGIRLLFLDKDLNRILEKVQTGNYTQEELIQALKDIQEYLFIGVEEQ
ncbi:hypothetical protein MKY20_19940 [Cytobacillus sp. FSL W8-0315]|uniref:hypothetical protein n=1 Tax=Cytobacillus sp. FSL W8-0315 TaxID=2921600 RepID=UPI0030F74CBA